MSQRTAVIALPSKVGEPVTVNGWIYHRRTAGKLLLRRDPRRQRRSSRRSSSGARSRTPAFEAVEKVPLESSVSVDGHGARRRPRSPGGVELSVTGSTVVGACVGEFPIGKKEHGIGFLMEQRHLYLRAKQADGGAAHPRRGRARAARVPRRATATRRSTPPSSRRSAAEGTANLFRVDYFGEPAFLSQTGQLYMEAAAQALGKVYCFGPTFRAEKSKTRRHLTEFWMLEPEIAFGDLDEVMALMEGVRLARGRARPRAPASAELEVLERDVDKPRGGQGRPSRASPTTRRSKRLEGHARPPSRGARTSARRRRTRISAAVRPPGPDPPLPDEDQGVLHAPDPARPEVALGLRPDRARGLRRDHRGRRALRATSPTSSARSPRRASRRRPTSGTSTCAATAPARARASGSASSARWPGSAASTTRGRRRRSRAP